MKTITINNKIFEVHKSKHYTWYDVESEMHNTKLDLFDCYKNPSYSKISIFNYWRNWCDKADGVNYLTIRSFNSNFFTLFALYTDEETLDSYYLLITPSHNYAYRLD